MSTVEAPASHLPLPMQNILSRLAANSTEAEQALVRKAYAYAAAAHAGQVRLSGEPYLSHPLAVAEVLAELGFDAHSVAAGLLHDTVEDTKVTLEEVDAEFGEQVADIVDGVTKISMMTFDSKEEQQAENIRKMILAMSHDIRVPIVKLADRVHNMRTLDFQKAHKRQRIAQETMDIYVPLANRLGLHRLKLELEGLSFKYIHPDVYAQISDWLESNQVVERQLIAKIIAKLEGILSSNQIEGTVWGRIKHIYSIYKKMTEQNLTLDDMHDILAFRVIVKDVRDCYAVLGLVHAQWKPVPGRFKDYISMPKANGYQSLHTTVIGPEGERIEIQIRTEEMHRLAEAWRGLALAVQGAPSRGQRQGRSGIRVAPGDRQPAGAGIRLQGIHAHPAHGSLQGRSLCLHARGRRKGTPRRCDAAGLRLPHPYAGGQPVRGREGQRQAGSAEYRAQERRHGGNHHRQEPPPEPGLAQDRQDRQGAQPYPAVPAYRGTRGGDGPWPRNAGKGSPQGRHQPEQGREGRASEHAGEQPCRRVSGRADGLHRVRAFHDQAGGEAFAGHCFAAGNP